MVSAFDFQLENSIGLGFKASLVSDMTCCFLRQEICSTLSFSIQMYQRVPLKECWGVTLRWISILSHGSGGWGGEIITLCPRIMHRGNSNTSPLLHAKEKRLSSSFMGHLSRKCDYLPRINIDFELRFNFSIKIAEKASDFSFSLKWLILIFRWDEQKL